MCGAWCSPVVIFMFKNSLNHIWQDFIHGYPVHMHSDKLAQLPFYCFPRHYMSALWVSRVNQGKLTLLLLHLTPSVSSSISVCSGFVCLINPWTSWRLDEVHYRGWSTTYPAQTVSTVSFKSIKTNLKAIKCVSCLSGMGHMVNPSRISSRVRVLQREL